MPPSHAPVLEHPVRGFAARRFARPGFVVRPVTGRSRSGYFA